MWSLAGSNLSLYYWPTLEPGPICYEADTWSVLAQVTTVHYWRYAIIARPLNSEYDCLRLKKQYGWVTEEFKGNQWNGMQENRGRVSTQLEVQSPIPNVVLLLQAFGHGHSKETRSTALIFIYNNNNNNRVRCSSRNLGCLWVLSTSISRQEP